MCTYICIYLYIRVAEAYVKIDGGFGGPIEAYIGVIWILVGFRGVEGCMGLVITKNQMERIWDMKCSWRLVAIYSGIGV